MLDREQVLTLVWNHLMEQGRPALGRGIRRWRCVYRSADGAKCAIGVLIADKVFSPALNGEPLISSGVMEMLLDSGWDIDFAAGDYDFLLALQGAHDEQKMGPNWATEVALALSKVRRDHIEGASLVEVDSLRQGPIDGVDQLARIDVQGSGDCNEFEDVEPTLKLLDLVHE